MRLQHALRPVSAVLAGLALLLAVAGCGSSSSSSSGATSSSSPPTTSATSAAACAQVAALKSSLEALTKVRPLQDGLDALNTAVANVKTSLDAAVAAVQSDLQPAVAQVQTAFDAVQTSVSGLTADNLRQKAPSIIAALQQLGTATTALATTLQQRCPSS